MAYLAASALNRNNRRSSSGPSGPSRKDQYLATIFDDIRRGDTASFSKHASAFYSEFADTPREKLDDKIFGLRPMMYAILHANVAMVETLLKQFPGTFRVDGTFVRPNFDNGFNKYIPDFPPELEGKTYRAAADIGITKTSLPENVVEQYKQIKKLLLRSGAKPKTHFGKLVFPEDKADVDYYNATRSKGGRNAKSTYKRKHKTRHSTRRRRQTKRR